MRRIRDNEGDVWQEQSNGSFELVESDSAQVALGLTLPLGDVEEMYGPVDDVVPGGSLVEFVTELRELCDRWAAKLGA